MAVKKSRLDELERFQARSRKQWRTWLERHHLTSPA